MSNPLDVHRTQNTAPVFEFRCLYTADLRRKQKRWQDGRLKYHSFNKRVMVYDEKSNFVGDAHWREDYELCDGEELQLERGGILVQVEEKLETHNQDLSELVDKPRKEKEARAAARTANGSPGSFAGRAQQLGTPTHPLLPKTLNSLLTPSGHHGRAQAPVDSPFEERQKGRVFLDVHEDERPSKRRRRNDPVEVKSSFAQNITGAMLSLASSKPSSTPTIRYEAFKAKFSVPQKPAASIDLTSDDDEDVLLNKKTKPVQLHDRTGNSQAGVHKPKHRRSLPVKSGYASHLTGVVLALKEPPPTASTRPVKILNVERSRATNRLERGHSKFEDQVPPKGDCDPHTYKTNLKETGNSATVSVPYHQRKSNSPSACLEKELVSKLPSPRAIVNPIKNTKAFEFDSHSSGKIPPKVDSFTLTKCSNSVPKVGDHEATNSRELRRSLEAGTYVGSVVSRKSESPRSVGSFTSEINSVLATETPYSGQVSEDGDSPKALHMRSLNRKREKRPQKTKASRSSSCNVENAAILINRLPTTTSLSGTDRVLNASVTTTSAQDKFVPTLRIKSRQPRKMMMLMDRSNPPVTLKPRALSKNAENVTKRDMAAKNGPALSQQTIELDSLIQRQEERIQARLHKSRSRPSINFDDLSSPPPETEITHQNIERPSFSKEPPTPLTETKSAHYSPGTSSDLTVLLSTEVSKIKYSHPALPTPKVPQMPQSGPTEPSSVALSLSNDVRPGTTNVPLRKASPLINPEPEVAIPHTSLPLNGSVSEAGVGDTLQLVPDLPYIQTTATTTTDLVGNSSSSIVKEAVPEVANSKASDEATPSPSISCLESGVDMVSQRSAPDAEKMLPGHQELKPPLCTLQLQEQEGEPRQTPPNQIIHVSRHKVDPQKNFKEAPKIPKPNCADAVMPMDEYEQSTIVTSRLRKNANSSPAAAVLAQYEPMATKHLSTAQLERSIGAATRTINSLGSRWQGADSTNGSEFALSIATSNQPKFKLSKPIARIQPLGPPPLRYSSRLAPHNDNLSNGSCCDGGGIPVTATGPWSREAFDLFGFWKPITEERTRP
jgi:hypothetical protein